MSAHIIEIMNRLEELSDQAYEIFAEIEDLAGEIHYGVELEDSVKDARQYVKLYIGFVLDALEQSSDT